MSAQQLALEITSKEPVVNFHISLSPKNAQVFICEVSLENNNNSAKSIAFLITWVKLFLSFSDRR